jgi:hypothetical protein
VLARKRREYLDMVPEFYDIENDQRTEEEVGALRQVGRSSGSCQPDATATAAATQTASCEMFGSTVSVWHLCITWPCKLLSFGNPLSNAAGQR